MSFENPTPTPEKEAHYPSLEEIRWKIRQLSELRKQANPETVRTRGEGNDVYMHETVTTDDKGDAYLYTYRKVSDHPESKSTTTLIEVAYYIGRLEDGMCVGGDILSEYDETTGQWKDTR